METHVNVDVWKQKINEMTSTPEQNCGGIALVKEVLTNLVYGCDSQVGPPGDSPTVTPNSFSEPSIDIPRIADALAEEVKEGHRLVLST